MNTQTQSFNSVLFAMPTPTFDPLKGCAMVLSRPTGHYLIDGVSGRTLLYATRESAGRVFRLAMQRKLVLVNEGSDKGKAILARLHSHATAKL